MSKYNVRTARATASGPLVTEAQSSGKTHEGGAGYARDARSELFLRATASFAGEGSFYEDAVVRDDRLRDLTTGLAIDPDGFAWLSAFLPWLRAEGNMRTTPVMLAAEVAKARSAKGAEGGTRQLVGAVLQRADEPGEMVAYWHARFGRKMPIAVKRGIADAILRLYSEFSLMKWDSRESAYRFGDVIELVQPRYHGHAYGTWRDALYRYAIERRHNRDNPVPEALAMIRANAALRARAAEDASVLLDPAALKAAGMTWEDALSLAGGRVPKRDLWAALLPSLGYMAAIRNLRNLDEAGISDETAAVLAARIADPEQVAKSRQLPFRFLAAYENAPSLRWGHALEKALDACVRNIPVLDGRTLILIDTSASMGSKMSGKSTMSMVKAAALFGHALAMKNPAGADVYGFADGQFRADGIRLGASVLKATEGFCGQIGIVGHGTQIAEAVRRTYQGHDRVVIFTDMQTFPDYHAYSGDVAASVPQHIPVYGFNLAGYTHSAMPSGHGNRHELGGLSDATFRILPMIEAGKAGRWPWDQAD